MARAAKLFGLEESALSDLLLVKSIQLPGQATPLTVRLLGSEAAFRRDAVSRALYAGVFSWLVAVANGHLGDTQGNKDLPFIGVLDIFGFESFAENGLEQILINFANEYLQNVFNKQVGVKVCLRRGGVLVIGWAMKSRVLIHVSAVLLLLFFLSGRALRSLFISLVFLFFFVLPST